MTITPAQQNDIHAVLWYNVKYRETFDELYDHILTSIEHEPEGTRQPHEIAHDIIYNEFGGWDQLKKLERSREKAIRAQLWRKVWQYVKEHFSFPLIAFTLIAASAVYYLTDHVPRHLVFMVMYAIAMAPVVLWGRAAPNRWSKRYKATLYEGIAERLGTVGMGFFNCAIFAPALLLNNEHYKYIQQAHASFLAIIAVICLIYSLSVIKIYKEDLKLSILKWN
jgi:hypothetical protein